MSDFLDLSARTRRFTHGAPRAFAFGDGARLLYFLRSSGPTDPYDSLWVLDTTTGVERLLADPRALAPEGGELPVAERRLRERIRLVAAGIGSFALSGDGRRAVFALYGRLYAVEADGGAGPREIRTAGPAFDPRPDADGSTVAYVCEDALHLAPGGRISPADGARWGLAEFAAAEELDRPRGHWWSPEGLSVLAARVDDSALERRHFADAAHPERPAEDFAYPTAGGPNADVQLWVLGPQGRRVRLDWDAERFPYVCDAGWESEQEILLTVADRLQQQVLLLCADPATGRTRELSRTTHPQWVDRLPGTPARLPDGRVLTSVDTPGQLARGLAVDGKPLTGGTLQVRRVAGVHQGRLLVEGALGDPAEQQVLLIDPDTGELTPVADGPGVHTVAADAGALLLTTADADGFRRTLTTADGRALGVRDLAEPLPYRVTPVLERVTEHGVPTALVLPRGHAPGSRRLPVLLDSYGGPGYQDVSAEPRRWQARQWWADQGFAVVTIDNRGTANVSPAFTHAMYRGFSAVTLEDQVAALAALGARHRDLDLGRVGVRGWSYGGYLAAMAVLRRPDVFHAASAGAPPTDFRLYDTAYTERYLGLPQENPEVYERDCLIGDAPRLSRPLLLITGLADDNVHPSHTLRLSQALTDAGRPHQLLALPGVTHMTPYGVQEKLMRQELAFFRRELGVA
ncbi:S9 family peptidase [Streptomyces antimicrobicus]|uniref:Prolyl oligopeptidase family serine peptidase n=1 Tax=Streptomyces antimicrobicus TaxID=2883108 RepID=A0ABS8BBP7_9ACTN|nr:prolyl oligopeptidase family serine peptidase [Streptomyces antimicrobicus]MCB5181959.1 prolyl oligopeptidase family serine peptidase [Streptomyces antimicrobicus]